ncbi:unnamed protein product [Adineta steineri]|uniref:G-protein coupled receptors family 1 profile domain-containing protein n=1 Tax=Adineta steineri TaxID=433720 RepID=A0A815RWZ3_9BILA|nr:unnamed protein product [Adineta steineri]CAF1482565.1 unnamed protein product [Adineta steineri]
MSSNSTEAALIATLAAITTQINRYLPIGIFFFGIIGNLLNCLALSQRTLLSNSCSLLFLASSIASLITLIDGVGVRFLTGWSADLTATNDILCQIRFFFLSTSRTVAFWLISLAIIDRWLLSSINVHRRQMSTLKNTQRGIIFVIILSSLVYVQYFYCFVAIPIDYPITCYGRSILCRLIHNLEFALLSVLIPSLLMIIFGLMTIHNVHKSALRQVQPIIATSSTQTTVANERSARMKKIDHQLLIMLCVQTTLVILFSLPQACYSIYTVITQYDISSPLTNAIDTLLLNVFILFSYVTNGMPFYVYTLSGGTVYRKAFFDRLQDFSRMIICR